jgi:UDP-N-acetylmuramyl pentapeptide phosphotransferase/UDP-N-acetylglucosamine-1-phosphate transferase
MHHSVKYIAVLGVSMLTVLALTPLFIKSAPKLGLIDHPNERCIHNAPIPLAGGFIVFLGFHLACFALFFYVWPQFSGKLNSHWWVAFFCASFLLLVVGLLDDRFNISPIVKLIGQSSAALLMYSLFSYNLDVLNIELNFFWQVLFILIWNLTIINAFNLIDGLDGLCSGLSLISSLGLAAVFVLRGSPADALICLALVGSCFGFLYYNFFPAKVFLGDTGSMFLGFALANISLQAGGKGSLFVIFAALFFVAGIPVIDTLLAIWRRSIRKMLAKNTNIKIMGADREHLHHRLLATGLKQKHVAYTLYAVNIVIVIVGISYFIFRELATGLFLIMLIITLYLSIRYLLKIELWETSRLFVQKFEHQLFNKDFSIILYLLFDLIWIAMATWLSGFFILNGQYQFNSFSELGYALIFWSFPTFLLIFLSDSYLKVWRTGAFRDYFFLIMAIVTGGLISLSIFLILHAEKNHFIIISQACLFILFVTVGVVGIRIPFHLFREWGLYNANPNITVKRNILIYGAGQHGCLYLRAHYLNYTTQFGKGYVIGFIDDEPLLHKKYIFGLPVLGGVTDLEKIIAKYQINEIVLTARISSEHLALLRQLTDQLNITLQHWSVNAGRIPDLDILTLRRRWNDL